VNFIAWYDDDRKRTLAQKIADACEAFQSRMGIAATVALISLDDGPAPADALVRIESRSTIRRNTVWAGRDE
jgi:hypothetical protein